MFLNRPRSGFVHKEEGFARTRRVHNVKDVFAMPPKARITKEMIVDAAFAVVRRSGVDEINVRKVANELGCSTQPVMYHFKTVEELKEEVYDVSADYFRDFVFGEEAGGKDALTAVGSRCLDFAREEAPLFRFIFQSGRFKGDHFGIMLDSEKPDIIGGLTGKGLSEDEAKLTASAFLSAVHGYASLVANGNAEYSDTVANKILDTFGGK